MEDLNIDEPIPYQLADPARPTEYCNSCGLPMSRSRRKGSDPAEVRHHGRGRCAGCYVRLRRLHKYGRAAQRAPEVPRDVMLNEWVFLRREYGMSAEEIAERLGMRFLSFERAMYRAKAAGDPRAQDYWRVA